MPGIPLVSRQANYSRDNELRAHLSEEELAAANETLSVYCRPVELYNILRRRFDSNPSFLQRCLHYKVQEKNKRRVQLSLSTNTSTREGLQIQPLFPFYIILATPLSTPIGSYTYKRACKLTAIDGAQPKFNLPEISNLSTRVRSGTVVMLLVSYAGITDPDQIDLTLDHLLSSTNDTYCLMGKIPIDFLHSSPNLSLGEKVQTTSVVSMQSCFMKLSCSNNEKVKCLSFRFPRNSEDVSILQQVPVMITAEELGRKDISPYDLYSYNNIPTNSLPHVIRLRTGNVIFNYKYYNNMLQTTEVTEDYTCPFCLIRCGNYKGLKCHLLASHDLLRYEFWVNEDYQVVVVSARNDPYVSEVFGSNADLTKHLFSFCHKPLKRGNSTSQNQTENEGRQLVLNSNTPTTVSDSTGVFDPVESDAPHASESAGAPPSVPVTNLQHPKLLQFAKTRKLSIEPSGPRNQMLLQTRYFFHSHRAQPMELEQVYADEDSEDEVDDDVADLEDRRMLDDFVDVAKDEKQIMHLWNSFVRKQRVVADGHVPWACLAFIEVHGKYLIENPVLQWSWTLLLVKLVNHGLLDSKTMNKCSKNLQKYRHPTQ